MKGAELRSELEVNRILTTTVNIITNNPLIMKRNENGGPTAMGSGKMTRTPRSVMSLVDANPGSEAPAPEERRWLDVLLMYQDISTGLRARRLLDHVAISLKLEVDFRVSLWKFDLLREPALLEQATEEAAKADLVFFSAHGPRDVPAAVNLWFQRWLGRKTGEPCALPVLLDLNSRDTAATNLLLETLRALAGPAGVDVFFDPADTPLAEWAAIDQDLRRRAETRTELLEKMPHRMESPSHRDWGINE